jgi:hypothetical protein
MYTTHLHKNTHQTSPDVRLWQRWTLATALGELLGFAVPALVGPLALALNLDDLFFSIAVVIAGAFEGAILGSFQWWVLKRYLPNMTRFEWALATALAAVLAYSAAMVATNVGDLSRFNWLILALGASVLGVIFLLSMGFFQWLVLRRYLPHSGHWITANAIAWPLGVLIPVVGIMLVPDGSATLVFVVVGIGCGVLMGLVVGAITGWELITLWRNNLSAGELNQEV